MIERWKTIVGNKKILLVLFTIFALLSSLQLLQGTKTFCDEGVEYTKYNNYKIFTHSFEHLKGNQDLYTEYPEEHWDLYKYTPSFAAFFGLFNMLPDWVGLSLWNLLNALVLFFAIYSLTQLSNYQKGLMLILVLIELTTSMQNAQSNGLIAGLLVLSLSFMEKDKPIWATLVIVFSAFIKLFGIVGFVIFLFYPKKIKVALYTLMWTILIAALPLLFIDWTQYALLYKSYLNMLANDHSMSYGYSVMGWLHTWFGLDINKNLVVGLGILLFLSPLMKFRAYSTPLFRMLMLNSVLLWIVIFNHKAESPTFIIAMTGAALWFVISPKNQWNTLLMVSAFIFTSLSPTDIFPRFVRENYFIPYAIKAVPCIAIWGKIIYDLLTFDSKITSCPDLQNCNTPHLSK